VDLFPGIRYTGRLSGDPLGQMTLGEGVIINGSGVQTTTNSRWGDYTSLNVDAVDDCTFWYVNEYFYEKVVKVKADVAALHIFFLSSQDPWVAWRVVKGVAVKQRSS
jgi:hypothetical protein